MSGEIWQSWRTVCSWKSRYVVHREGVGGEEEGGERGGARWGQQWGEEVVRTLAIVTSLYRDPVRRLPAGLRCDIWSPFLSRQLWLPGQVPLSTPLHHHASLCPGPPLLWLSHSKWTERSHLLLPGTYKGRIEQCVSPWYIMTHATKFLGGGCHLS